MQTLSYGQLPIATLASFDVNGEQGVGASQLVVALHLIMQPTLLGQGKQVVPRITAIHGDIIVPGAHLCPLQVAVRHTGYERPSCIIWLAALECSIQAATSFLGGPFGMRVSVSTYLPRS